jgi:hypothetical protein
LVRHRAALIHAVVLGLRDGGGLLVGAAAAAEPAADGVADGGADCYTAIRGGLLACFDGYRGYLLKKLTQQCWPSGRTVRSHRSVLEGEPEHVVAVGARRSMLGGPALVLRDAVGRLGAWERKLDHEIGEA